MFTLSDLLSLFSAGTCFARRIVLIPNSHHHKLRAQRSVPKELKCSVEDLFAPDTKERETETKVASDGTKLVQTTSVRASGEIVTVWRKESRDVELVHDE